MIFKHHTPSPPQRPSHLFHPVHVQLSHHPSQPLPTLLTPSPITLHTLPPPSLLMYSLSHHPFHHLPSPSHLLSLLTLHTPLITGHAPLHPLPSLFIPPTITGHTPPPSLVTHPLPSLVTHPSTLSHPSYSLPSVLIPSPTLAHSLSNHC